MCTTNIGVVLTGIAPQQHNEVAGALAAELKRRVTGTVCVITDISAGASAQETVQAIIQSLEKGGLIPPASADGQVYSAAEEEKIRKRLEDLGYL
jgi:stage V sporulation protein SpoVS